MALNTKYIIMKVQNMISSKGNSVPNQFIVRTDKGKMFQSYNSNIAFIPRNGDKISLGIDWDYSKTTGKYRNIFLGETKKETEAKIISGVYVVDNNL